MTDSPWLAAICERRRRNPAVGMPATSPRNRRPPAPLTGGGGKAGDLKRDRDGTAERVAGGIDPHRCEPARVHVDGQNGFVPEVLEARRGSDRQLPRGVQGPATPLRVEGDVVAGGARSGPGRPPLPRQRE